MWWKRKGSRIAVSLCMVGCAPVLTPRPEDSSAPHDFYRSLVPQERKCKRDVPLLHASELEGRAFHEVSAVSATCYPGAPNVCRQTLIERACELHADALILDESTGSGTPPGASSQSAISLSGRAVNWDTPQ